MDDLPKCRLQKLLSSPRKANTEERWPSVKRARKRKRKEIHVEQLGNLKRQCQEQSEDERYMLHRLDFEDCCYLVKLQVRGRTDNATKNHWNSTLKRKYSAATVAPIVDVGMDSDQSELRLLKRSTNDGFKSSMSPGCSASDVSGYTLQSNPVAAASSPQPSTAHVYQPVPRPGSVVPPIPVTSPVATCCDFEDSIFSLNLPFCFPGTVKSENPDKYKPHISASPPQVSVPVPVSTVQTPTVSGTPVHHAPCHCQAPEAQYNSQQFWAKVKEMIQAEISNYLQGNTKYGLIC